MPDTTLVVSQYRPGFTVIGASGTPRILCEACASDRYASQHYIDTGAYLATSPSVAQIAERYPAVSEDDLRARGSVGIAHVAVSCNLCYRTIATVRDERYCDCADGCLAGDCVRCAGGACDYCDGESCDGSCCPDCGFDPCECEPYEDDDDDGYERSTACTCDNCIAGEEYVQAALARGVRA